MTAPPLSLALLPGSTCHRRFSRRVADWAQRRLAGHADLVAEFVLPAPWEADANRRLHRTDAFLVILPDQPVTGTADLAALFATPAEAWHARPVGFLTYGGRNGGRAAIERLRPWLVDRQAIPLGENVDFIDAWERLGARGKLYAPLGEDRRLARLLPRLQWWARALRDARQDGPGALSAGSAFAEGAFREGSFREGAFKKA
ncbi:NAD(P)H-dependent oxidoreductase [Modicisalibacter sp. 'Wilcox']|uniref:NAD(P)H-dependent oxidoreductase n=1 Tax=Modicisalibacter sp. 'Wilcox' TaxID=2679914 RepID=UPI0013D5E072|nr:NAD(P)H-dependent oxidoreductase [Modicisalibacter sp. 'Wilcox']